MSDASEWELTQIRRPWPDPLAREAHQGLVGEFVDLIAPETEADPAALLFQFLVAVGNVVGHGPHFMAEADSHALNLFVVLVGESSKGRKGTSWGHVKRVVCAVDETWPARLASGLSTGEGLIANVRDAWQEDPGEDDKRFMVVEGEYSGPLKVMKREGNTLSPVLRNAWDRGDLRTLVRNSPLRATGAHISVVGHITRTELLRHMSEIEAANGFANRHLFVCTRRSQVLPEGGNQPDVSSLVEQLKRVHAFAQTLGVLRRDEEARDIWFGVYPELSEGKPGLLGAVIARAEAQVMRIASLYAVLDCSPVIRRPHLEAALACWDYVERSAVYIFGDALGNPVADEVLRLLRAKPSGLTRTEIRDYFGRHQSANEIDRAVMTLAEQGLARMYRQKTSGRPAELWRATEATEATKAPFVASVASVAVPS